MGLVRAGHVADSEYTTRADSNRAGRMLVEAPAFDGCQLTRVWLGYDSNPYVSKGELRARAAQQT